MIKLALAKKDEENITITEFAGTCYGASAR